MVSVDKIFLCFFVLLIYYLHFCRQRLSNVYVWHPGFSLPEELNSNEQHSVLRLEKKLTSTFVFLDKLASLKPAIIESSTISVVLGFHSSASVLLSVLLVGLYVSDFALANIGGVSVSLTYRKYVFGWVIGNIFFVLIFSCLINYIYEINRIFNRKCLSTVGTDFSDVNSLSTNPTKWSNTFKQFIGNSRRIVWVCLTILWGWCLKG